MSRTGSAPSLALQDGGQHLDGRAQRQQGELLSGTTFPTHLPHVAYGLLNMLTNISIAKIG